MRQFNILIVGLIRDKKKFQDVLFFLSEMKKKGYLKRLVLSTWEREVKGQQEVINLFQEKSGLEVVSLSEPNIKLPGHLVHQMKALYYGLSVFEEDDYVLKIRLDLSDINEAKIKYLYQLDSYRTTIEQSVPSIFSEKIGIEGGFLFSPFYLNDITFYGKKLDLSKLVNLDLMLDVKYSNLSPEQWFHFSPFIGSSIEKAFDNYFRMQEPLISHEPLLNNERLAKKLKSNYFKNIIRLYFSILNIYYFPITEITNKKANLSLFENSDLIQINRNTGLPYFKDLSLVCESKILGSNDIISLFDKQNNIFELIEYLSTENEGLIKYRETLNDIDQPSFRYFSKVGLNSFSVLNDKPIRAHMLSNSPTELKLQHEINRLRRLLDSTNK
ncbi:hypothetical protein AADZ84_11070 [Colwelliaceae bacterium MEBiC 14330]